MELCGIQGFAAPIILDFATLHPGYAADAPRIFGRFCLDIKIYLGNSLRGASFAIDAPYYAHHILPVRHRSRHLHLDLSQ